MNMHLPVGRPFVGGIGTNDVFGSSCCCGCCCFVSVDTHVSDAIDILPHRLMYCSPDHFSISKGCCRLWEVWKFPVWVMRHVNLGLKV